MFSTKQNYFDESSSQCKWTENAAAMLHIHFSCAKFTSFITRLWGGQELEKQKSSWIRTKNPAGQ